MLLTSVASALLIAIVRILRIAIAAVLVSIFVHPLTRGVPHAGMAGGARAA